MEVGHIEGEAYEIRIRDHCVRVDQPVDTGRSDSAPTPTELFVGTFAACVAFYAGRYLSRHGLNRDRLSVCADFDLATDRPARVSVIRITVRVPEGFPADRRPALTAVVSHCTVHNPLINRPAVTITVE